MRHYRRLRGVGAVGIAGFIIAGALVFGGIVMLLWNALMPDLFHLPLINFWQALGLLLLAKIFFSGFRGGSFPGRWRERARQRWMNMSPEERERFKQEWDRRCDGRFPAPEGRRPEGPNTQRPNMQGPNTQGPPEGAEA